MSNSADIRFSELSGFKTQKLLKTTRGDKVIWALVLLLVLISLLVVYSATGSLAYKIGDDMNYLPFHLQLAGEAMSRRP